MIIKFSSDSTCDMPKQFIKEFDVSIFPLIVTLGENEYLDGVNVQPDDLYSYVNESGNLPKTAARSIEDFKEYFLKLLKKCDVVIHCGIGSKLSACYENACSAAREIGEDKVIIVDSKALSVGSSLVILSGASAYRSGASLQEIVENMKNAADNVQSSFMVDRLDYLHKGGRVSKFTFSVATFLRIKPRLEVIEGKLINTGKEVGPYKSVVIKYVDSILKKYDKPRKDLCIVCHTKMDKAIVDKVVDYVKSKNIFDNVVECHAGSVITSHCGEGTLGILYINDGEN